jgi:hypothetical protein
LNETYNTLIKAIGNQFENLTLREHGKILQELNKINIRHEELFKETFSQAVNKESKEHKNDYTSFNTVVVPLLNYMTNNNLTSHENFEKLVFGDAVKDIIRSENATFQQKALDERTNHIKVLVSILESGLDLTHPEMKDIVRYTYYL